MAGPAPTVSLEGAAQGATVDGAAAEGGEAENGVCPYYHRAVELVGKRWTGAIIHALLPGSLRFCEIAQAIPQISDRLLSSRLKELEGHGIVRRQVFAGAPVRVDYALTAQGRALEPAVSALRLWAREWLKAR